MLIDSCAIISLICLFVFPAVFNNVAANPLTSWKVVADSPLESLNILDILLPCTMHKRIVSTLIVVLSSKKDLLELYD